MNESHLTTGQEIVNEQGPLVFLSQSPQQAPQFFKQLSKSEFEERRLKGLCFSCDKPFNHGHKCKKLFSLDLLEEEDDSVEEPVPDSTKEEQLEISLNAIIGVSSLQNLLGKGRLHEKEVMALIDSGSTQKFISENVIKLLNLPIEQRGGLRVVMVNGERVKSRGLCRQVPLMFN